jgi:hypothetical protein
MLLLWLFFSIYWFSRAGSKLTEFLLTNESKAGCRPEVSEKKDAHKVGKMLLKHQCVFVAVATFFFLLFCPPLRQAHSQV